MKKTLVVVVLCLSMTLLAQDKPTNVKVPVVTIEHREAFYKKRAELLEAQIALQDAQKAVQDAYDGFKSSLKDSQADCGTENTLILDKDKELVCVPKTATPNK
jgi:hypothetical protein